MFMLTCLLLANCLSAGCELEPYIPNQAAAAIYDDMLFHSPGSNPADLDKRLLPAVNGDKYQAFACAVYVAIHGTLSGEYTNDDAVSAMYGASLLYKEMDHADLLELGLSMMLNTGDLASHYGGFNVIETYCVNRRHIDYAVLDPHLDQCLASSSRAVQAMVFFMYQNSLVGAIEHLEPKLQMAKDASDLLDSALAQVTPDATKANELRLRTAKWTPENRLPPPDDKAREILLKMAGREEWWMVLFACELARQVPTYQDPALLEVLGKSDNPFIKVSLKGISIQDPSRIPSTTVLGEEVRRVRKQQREAQQATDDLGNDGPCDESPFRPNDEALLRVSSFLTEPGESREAMDASLKRLQDDLGMDDMDLLATVSYQFFKGIEEGVYVDDTGYVYIVMMSPIVARMSDMEELRSGLRLLAMPNDQAARRASWLLLSFGDDNSSQIDFRRYEEYLKTCFDTKTQTLESLVGVLFQRNAVDTLDFVLHKADVNEERLEELLHANEIARRYYPKVYGIVRAPGEPSSEEIAAFLDAMQGDEWWLQLYFAEVVRKVYAFQTEEVLARLRAIDHPVVKEALRAIEAQDPVKRVPLAR